MPHRPMRSFRSVAALAATFLLTGCFTVVDSSEWCVPTRYGNPTADREPNGLTLTVLSDVTCFPQTEVNYPAERGETEPFEAQTSDPVTVTGKVRGTFTFKNVPALFKSKREPEAAKVYAISALREAIGVATQQRSISELFGPGRATFGDSVRAIAQRKVGPDIEMGPVFVSDLHAPPAIEKARIIAAQKAQELDAARQQLQIDSTRATGVRITSDAEAYRQRQEAEALSASPDVLRLRAAEAMAKGMANVCGKATTCIVGGSVTDLWRGGIKP